MSNVLKAMWHVDIPKDQVSELLGEIIDVFEDFLDEKGITTEMIPNADREENDDDAAIIYGNDYDVLADKISSILGVER